VLFLNPSEEPFPAPGVRQKQHGRFGERALQADVAHLGAAGAQRLAARLLAVCHGPEQARELDGIAAIGLHLVAGLRGDQ
jgi:hypothetical protein